MAVTSPQQFRVSVDDRLRRETGRPVNRRRTLLVMERFLTRVVTVAPTTFVLKGGLALELRLARARTTRDLDLRASGDPDQMLAVLTAAARLRPEPEDHIDFTVVVNERPESAGDGVRYDGRRFLITSSIAARPFGDPFGVDIAIADPLLREPDVLVGSDFFGRYGMQPLRMPAYPIPTHLAEKVHAYTLPRSKPNSRLKDLVDIALLSDTGGHRAAEIRQAIALTFSFRASHPPPTAMPDPPSEWPVPYQKMRDEERLPWQALEDVIATARAFLDPVLAGQDGEWDAGSRRWVP